MAVFFLFPTLSTSNRFLENAINHCRISSWLRTKIPSSNHGTVKKNVHVFLFLVLQLTNEINNLGTDFSDPGAMISGYHVAWQNEIAGGPESHSFLSRAFHWEKSPRLDCSESKCLSNLNNLANFPDVSSEFIVKSLFLKFMKWWMWHGIC